MPRFNPNNYEPSNDSSPGAPKTGNVVLVLKDDSVCRCGCGQSPKNPKRSFVQGHDARLKGVLIRAAATDTKVEIREGKSAPQTITAQAAAKVFGWDAIVRKATAAYADKAKAAAERAKAAEKRRAVAAAKKAAKAKAAAKKAPAKKKATAKKATGRKASAPRKSAGKTSEPKPGTEVSA